MQLRISPKQLRMLAQGDQGGFGPCWDHTWLPKPPQQLHGVSPVPATSVKFMKQPMLEQPELFLLGTRLGDPVPISPR